MRRGTTTQIHNAHVRSRGRCVTIMTLWRYARRSTAMQPDTRHARRPNVVNEEQKRRRTKRKGSVQVRSMVDQAHKMRHTERMARQRAGRQNEATNARNALCYERGDAACARRTAVFAMIWSRGELPGTQSGSSDMSTRCAVCRYSMR